MSLPVWVFKEEISARAVAVTDSIVMVISIADIFFMNFP